MTHPLVELLRPKPLLIVAAGFASLLVASVWAILWLNESYCTSAACLQYKAQLAAEETKRVVEQNKASLVLHCRNERAELRQDYVNQAMHAATTDVQQALLARLEGVLAQPCVYRDKP